MKIVIVGIIDIDLVCWKEVFKFVKLFIDGVLI